MNSSPLCSNDTSSRLNCTSTIGVAGLRIREREIGSVRVFIWIEDG